MSARQGTGLEPIRIAGKRIQHIDGEKTNYVVERVARRLAGINEVLWPSAAEICRTFELAPSKIDQAKDLARMLKRAAK